MNYFNKKSDLNTIDCSCKIAITNLLSEKKH